MADDAAARLVRLARVRDERRKARERERFARRHALARAQAALAQQEAIRQAAASRLDEEVRSLHAFVAQYAATGTELVGALGFIGQHRAVVATEEAASGAARTVCDLMRNEDDRAARVLRQATAAHQKVETLAAEARARVQREVAALEALRADEAAVDRAIRARQQR